MGAPFMHTRRRGPCGQAKVLDEQQLRKLLSYVERNRHSPQADRLKILLSFTAGLRACEISGLHIRDVTEADGSTSDSIRIRAGMTKGGRGREIPICGELKDAIDDFRSRYPQSEWLAVSERYGYVKHQAPNSVTVWFHWLYRQCGLEGCSSHSGRRTFITRLARNLGPEHSLRDVQQLAGHVRLDTTQGYIDCSPNVRSLVNSISALVGDHGGEA
jgi:integrase/recombinase XerD